MDKISSSLSFQVGAAGGPGTPIDVETARFRLRTLGPGDASEAFLSWLADADLMEPLNMPARMLSIRELAAHIGAFDNRSRYMVGMFDRETGTHFGILTMDVNRTHGFGKMSYVIGDADFRRIGAFRETAAGLISHMFEAHGLEKVIVHVTVGNEPSMRALEALGFTNEGTLRSHVRSFVGEGRHDQHHYGILKGELIAP